MHERLTHLKATPGWVVTAVGVGGDAWLHHALTVLSALAILVGIAYHVTLIVCAVWKTRHEVLEIRRRQAPVNGYFTRDQLHN